jgi:hypothetical protein
MGLSKSTIFFNTNKAGEGVAKKPKKITSVERLCKVQTIETVFTHLSKNLVLDYTIKVKPKLNYLISSC